MVNNIISISKSFERIDIFNSLCSEKAQSVKYFRDGAAPTVDFDAVYFLLNRLFAGNKLQGDNFFFCETMSVDKIKEYLEKSDAQGVQFHICQNLTDNTTHECTCVEFFLGIESKMIPGLCSVKFHHDGKIEAYLPDASNLAASLWGVTTFNISNCKTLQDDINLLSNIVEIANNLKKAKDNLKKQKNTTIESHLELIKLLFPKIQEDKHV